MAFDPTNGFGGGALLDEALDAGKALMAALPTIAPGLLTRGYLHWAVSPYDSTFSDYNGMVILKDGRWALVVTHDPRDNAPGLNNNAEASHTWHRNTGAFGISIAGMMGADVHNFGVCPVQMHQLEYLCACAAAFCVKYGIDTNGNVTNGSTHTDNDGNPVNTTGEHNLLTHAECAVIDNYPSERWDLGSFIPLPSGVELTTEMRASCGSVLRARTHLYAAALKQ
jgi:hypothetical protein